MEDIIMLEECPICRGAGMILHEGGWVRMGYTYPLTFHAEGEAFDALWALCERLTAE